MQEVKTMEFTVDESFVKNLPQILSNVDELIAVCKKQTEIDRTLVVTEETIDDAKARSTMLNKVIDSIDKKRKEVKKAYNAPYELFDKRLKEATAVLTEAKQNLWSQVQAYEQKAKDEKEARLKKYYEQLVLSSETKFPAKLWENILDPAWLNKGKKESTVKEEIEKIFDQQKNDVLAIRALKSNFEVELLRMYLEDGRTLGDIIQANNHLNALKQGFSENEKTEEEELFRMEFFVETTKAKLQDLKRFMTENKIKYGRIEK